MHLWKFIKGDWSPYTVVYLFLLTNRSRLLSSRSNCEKWMRVQHEVVDAATSCYGHNILRILYPQHEVAHMNTHS